MHGTTALPHQTKRLDALDPGLAFLASRAAIEFDEVLLGNEVELRAVRSLAERLQNSTEEVSGSEDRKSLMDPATITMFSTAVAASGNQNVRTLGELAKEAWSLASELKGPTDNSDMQRIERLRNFCAYLAQSAVAHERRILEKQTFDKNWS